MRERRAAFEGKSHLVDEIIGDGTAVIEMASPTDTLRMVREAMGLLK